MKNAHTLSAKAVLAASAAFLAVPAIAQDNNERPSGDDFHGDASAGIVVTARFVEELDLIAGTSTLAGQELDQSIRPQIGDTLTALPGVSATSFTPGASRPVLRGFQGERIRVLTVPSGSDIASAICA